MIAARGFPARLGLAKVRQNGEGFINQVRFVSAWRDLV
jgi:hypothetical protein